MRNGHLVRWVLPATLWTFGVSVCLQAAGRGFWYGGFDPDTNKSGTQYWVSPTGHDANAGTRGQPWRTLDHARQSIRGGDTVNLLPGLYFFDGRFGPAGPSGQAKTVWRAADLTFRTGRVVLTKNESWDSPTWSHADNVSLQGLWIGGNFASAHAKGGASYSGRDCEVVNCTLFNAHGIYGGPSYNWLFQNNRMVHLGNGRLGHSLYLAGGMAHDSLTQSRNLHVLGNIILCGEGYAIHAWHAPGSVTVAGNFTSRNYWSLVLQGPNHSCHHNVFWRPVGNAAGGDRGQVGFNAWLPAPLRRFDHFVFGSPMPVWQEDMPPVRSQAKIEEIYLLYDATVAGVPKEACQLLTGRLWTGTLKCPELRGAADRLPYPGPTSIKPAFFPRTDREIDETVEAISKYFRARNPRQISEDRSDELERLFDILEVQYTTTAQDYENFPPMPQGRDDATYGVH